MGEFTELTPQEIEEILKGGRKEIGTKITSEFWDRALNTTHGREIYKLVEPFQEPFPYLQGLNPDIQKLFQEGIGVISASKPNGVSPLHLSPGLAGALSEELIPSLVTIQANLGVCFSTGYKLEEAMRERLNGVVNWGLVQKLCENQIAYLTCGIRYIAAGEFDLAEKIKPFGEAILAGNPVFKLAGTRRAIFLTL